MLTASAYYAAFCYESGYADYFGVPGYLFRVGTDTMLRMGVVLFAAVGVLANPAISLWSDLVAKRQPKSAGLRWILRMLTITGLLSWLLYYFGYEYSPFKVMLGVIAGIAVLFVLRYLVTWLAGLAARKAPRQEDPQQQQQQQGTELPLSHAELHLHKAQLAVGVVVIVSGLFWLLGKGSARRQEDFVWGVVGSMEVVVVGSTGDYVIVKDLHREVKAFGHVVRVIPVGTLGGRYEKIGPLRPLSRVQGTQVPRANSGRPRKGQPAAPRRGETGNPPVEGATTE